MIDDRQQTAYERIFFNFLIRTPKIHTDVASL